ncbi:MAG: thioredoxin family protein [Bacteroidota bacterium]
MKTTIKVLGTGCPKCQTLYRAVTEAVKELGIDADIVKEEDIVKIMNYGVLRTPGLVINDKVIMTGRVPANSELKDLLTQNM